MIQKTFTTLLIATLLGACSLEKQNVISGKVEGLAIGDKIMLFAEAPDGASWVATDSAIVMKADEFTLKTKVSDCFVRLVYLKSGEKIKPGNEQISMFFLESYADLKITGNTNEWRYLKTTGGLYNHPEILKISSINDSAQNLQNNALKIYKEALETNDTTLQQAANDLITKSNRMFRGADSLERNFVKNNPDAAYSAALLRYDYDLIKKFDDYEKAFYALSERVQNSPAGALTKSYITNVRASEVGAQAPDFTLKALDGQEVTLSNFRGKYVLIDFWGSWCGPCRQSSPLLVELYGDLKKNNANIEFIGIACSEQSDEKWTKAIENDKLTWIHLNDSHSEKGKSIQKQYAIRGVPTAMLVSPEGTILYREHPASIIPKVKSTVLN